MSDDTLIKQIDSREGQDFGLDKYALLPEMIANPIYFAADSSRGKNSYELVGKADGKLYLIALKYLDGKREIFLDSFRNMKDEELQKKMKKKGN